MTIQEQLHGNDDPAPTRDEGRPAKRRYRLHPLHEAAIRIADMGLGRSGSRTRDLVALLMCHAARAWRSSQPRTDLHLRVNGLDQRPAIRLSIASRVS